MKTYKSTLTIVIGFILISNYYNYKPLFIVALIIGLIAVFSEKANDKIIWAWNKLAEILALIMPNVLLTLVYYLFLTPLAIINRINRKKANPLQLKNSTASVYTSKRKEFSPESLEKIW